MPADVTREAENAADFFARYYTRVGVDVHAWRLRKGVTDDPLIWLDLYEGNDPTSRLLIDRAGEIHGSQIEKRSVLLVRSVVAYQQYLRS